MAAIAVPPAPLDPVPAVRPAEPAEPGPIRPRIRRLVVFTGKLP